MGCELKPEVGTPEWADASERCEWAFMAKMLAECEQNLPFKLSGVHVARQIAEERAKEGWRTLLPASPSALLKASADLAHWQDEFHDCDCEPHHSCGCKELRSIALELEIAASPPPPSGSAWGVKPNSPEDAELEDRAFQAANNPDVPDHVRVLITDLWREFVARESALTPSPSYAEGIEAAAWKIETRDDVWVTDNASLAQEWKNDRAKVTALYPLAGKPPAEDVQPPYPTGDVVGPCVCGSWPGGPCLKCEWVPAPPNVKVTP